MNEITCEIIGIPFVQRNGIEIHTTEKSRWGDGLVTQVMDEYGDMALAYLTNFM